MEAKETKESKSSSKELSPKEFALKIAKIASAKKGEDISLLNLHNISSLTDYLVIVSGLNERHLKALSDEINVQIKKELGIFSSHVDGDSNCKWVVMDYMDVIVHLFLSDERERYGLEKLWADAKITAYKD